MTGNSIRLRPSARASSGQTRQMNRRLVLQNVLTVGETSRAELSRLTELTPPTISDLVQDLIVDGLLEEAGAGESTGGKRPTLLRFRVDGRQLVALDLSRDTFEGYRTDLAGRTLQRERLTPSGPGQAALEAVLELAGRLTGDVSAPLLGIGIGTPGHVSDRGEVIEAANLEWRDVPLQARVAAHVGVPVHVGNDVHVAAIDEYGRDPALDNMIYVHVGTGIGAGVVINGRLHGGVRGAAGDIGHVRNVADGRRCTCGGAGCLETVASIPSILRAAGLDPRVDVAALLDAADEPASPGAASAIDAATTHLADVVAGLLVGLDVAEVIVGGPAAELGTVFLGGVTARLRERVPDALGSLLAVRRSTLGADAVLAGAWTLLLSRELGVMRS